jgi:hypothetical protein
LEKHQEHEEEAGRHGEKHHHMQNPVMERPDRDAEQEEADRCFAEDCRKAISNLTEPPVLDTRRISGGLTIDKVSNLTFIAVCRFSGVRSSKYLPVPYKDPPIMHAENMI